MRPRMLSATAFIVTLTLGACTLVADFIAGSETEQLVEEAVARWATPGRPFMEGAFAQDVVSAVTETGTRQWDVTVADERYALEVTRAEVLPVFAAEEFTRWMTNRARELGVRTFVPQDVLSLVTSGAIAAVGDLEVTFGEASGAARSTYERVAYLRADGGSVSGWSIQPESRSAMVLRDVLNAVYTDMIFTDDRVMDCLGAVGSGTSQRPRALACIGDVLALEYGGGPA